MSEIRFRTILAIEVVALLVGLVICAIWLPMAIVNAGYVLPGQGLPTKVQADNTTYYKTLLCYPKTQLRQHHNWPLQRVGEVDTLFGLGPVHPILLFEPTGPIAGGTGLPLYLPHGNCYVPYRPHYPTP